MIFSKKSLKKVKNLCPHEVQPAQKRQAGSFSVLPEHTLRIPNKNKNPIEVGDIIQRLSSEKCPCVIQLMKNQLQHPLLHAREPKNKFKNPQFQNVIPRCQEAKASKRVFFF